MWQEGPKLVCAFWSLQPVVMYDSNSRKEISGIILLLTGIGIGIGIKHLENPRNQNRGRIGNFLLESESESRLWIYPGIRIGIGIKHLPKSSITDLDFNAVRDFSNIAYFVKFIIECVAERYCIQATVHAPMCVCVYGTYHVNHFNDTELCCAPRPALSTMVHKGALWLVEKIGGAQCSFAPME